MANNKTTPSFTSDGLSSGACVTKNPSTAYTVLAEDNVIVCGGNSLAITLNADSNSPVYITSIDGTTQRTGCTIVANGASFTLADGGCAALCQRIAGGSTWMIIGAKTATA